MTSFDDVVYSPYFLHILLLRHGDKETNAWPQKEKIKSLSYCHWNVNSLIAHNLSKISQLEAYNSVHKHDFIHMPEGDINTQLGGYNLLRADHPSNSKRGGVSIFYKETLGVHIIKSLSFSEYILLSLYTKLQGLCWCCI